MKNREGGILPPPPSTQYWKDQKLISFCVWWILLLESNEMKIILEWGAVNSTKTAYNMFEGTLQDFGLIVIVASLMAGLGRVGSKNFSLSVLNDS